jgi:hypothetical protein
VLNDFLKVALKGSQGNNKMCISLYADNFEIFPYIIQELITCMIYRTICHNFENVLLISILPCSLLLYNVARKSVVTSNSYISDVSLINFTSASWFYLHVTKSKSLF